MRPTPRHIIICADDYGISPAVNAAIRDLIAHGRINATSVMVASPNFDSAEAAALHDVADRRAAIGLHVTLTAPFAPLSHGFAPLRHGAFLSLGATLRRAHLRTLQPDLLATEIARQFAAFIAAFGRPPDFVDGHQHVQLFPQIRDAFLRVAKDAAPRAWVRQCGRSGPARGRLTDHKALVLDAMSRNFRRRAAAYGLATNPAFAGTYAFRADAAYERLFAAFLDGLPDGGVIMCHPGKVDAALVRLDTLTDLREREYAFFLDDSFPRLLAEREVGLATVASR
ncbi:MAG TPA: ChbG/HpnK family deacetylase [Xanthobacteraceae bacterium]|nr:ChbG/HpnK family deacetylase [Xanthobacteraceae bacterium]